MNESTDGLGLFSVAEHQPSAERGHRSVTFTTMDFVTGGKNGGDDMNVFNSVKLKHFPQPGPLL
jgi:hypothetical protein